MYQVPSDKIKFLAAMKDNNRVIDQSVVDQCLQVYAGATQDFSLGFVSALDQAFGTVSNYIEQGFLNESDPYVNFLQQQLLHMVIAAAITHQQTLKEGEN